MIKEALYLAIFFLGSSKAFSNAIPCTHENIQSSLDHCLFVSEYCQPESMINFYQFYYCTTNQSLAAIIPTMIVSLLLGFYILATTADIYLSPSLTKISLLLGMSQNLAGVTLLALGNGAADVFSSIAASGNDQSGIYVSLGALVGSGFFVAVLVTSAIIFSSKNVIKVNPSSFIRDVVFFIIGLMWIAAFSLFGKINIYMGLSVLILYLVYESCIHRRCF